MLNTSDGVKVTLGLRVFTINARWGSVGCYYDGALERNGWFHIIEDGGDPWGIPLDGSRLSTRDNLSGNPDPRPHGACHRLRNGCNLDKGHDGDCCFE